MCRLGWPVWQPIARKRWCGIIAERDAVIIRDPHEPTQEGRALNLEELAKTIADVAADKKASDVVVLDIRESSVIADYFVICSGSNPRQIQAIASAIEDKLSELHVATRAFEGDANTGWMLLDAGDVIVHIFGPMEREFYRLERLWSGAQTVMHLQ